MSCFLSEYNFKTFKDMNGSLLSPVHWLPTEKLSLCTWRKLSDPEIWQIKACLNITFFFYKRQIIYPRKKVSALLMWLISSCSLSLVTIIPFIPNKERFQRRPWRWVVIVTWLCRDISGNFLSLWCIVLSVLIFSCHFCFN